SDPLMGLGEEALGAVLLGVVEGDALLQVRAGSVQYSQGEQGLAQRDMRIGEAGWIVDTLGQTEHLLSQLPRGLQLPPSDIKTYQSSQHGEEPRGLPHLLAQRACPLIGGLHVRRRPG